jgi:hypothetical protein
MDYEMTAYLEIELHITASLLWRRIPRYPKNRRLGGPHSGFESFREKQIMRPCKESNFRSSAVRPAGQSELEDSRIWV